MPARFHRAALVLMAAIASLVLALPGSGLAATDGDTLDERASTTWHILPAEGVVHVATIATLTNKQKPGGWHRVPCTGGKRGVCKERTRYYFDHWGTIWISDQAVDLAFGGPGVTDEFTDVSGSGSRYTVRFPRLHYNKKQQVTVDYDLPSAAAGVHEPTRIEDAYLHFCWYGEDADSGMVRAILPPGFQPISNDYGQPRVEQTADGVVLSSPSAKGNPAEFFVCTEAVAPDRYVNTYLAGDDGNGLVTIAAWPADTAWADRMIGEAKTARPWLEQQLGSPLPVGSLTVREVGTQGTRGVDAELAPVDGIIGVSEAARELGVLSVPMARTWFGPQAVRDPWLAEGLAAWSGLAAVGARCPVAAVTEPATAAAAETTTPVLSDWVVPGRNDGQPMWDHFVHQSAVACEIVQAAADAIGTEMMTAIVAELLTSPTPVGATDWLVEVAVASDADTVGVLRARIAEAGFPA